MEDLFVKSNGKKRVGKAVYDRKDVEKESFKADYGRLVQRGYVFFDFDEQPYVDIITRIIEDSHLKCRKLKTTRGVHFLFKTNKPKVTCNSHHYNWLGLQCDVKGVGLKEGEKQCYQAIKVNGVTREETCINHNLEDGIEVLDYAPNWLYQASGKRQVDLTTDQTGSRNTMFHGEMMIEAKKAGFSYEEYCYMAQLINDYVLPEGLPQNELDTAIRQEEWDKLAIGDDKIVIFDMAMDAIKTWSCVMTNNGMMYYDESLGYYSGNLVKIECYLQEKYSETNITTNKIKEVMEQMNIQLNSYNKYQANRNSEYVVCKDKLVSMWKDEVKDLTRTIVTDVAYPYSIMSKEEYDNYEGLGKKFLNDISCGNKDVLAVICECLGCMLAPISNFGKVFVWYGSGANGKSVLLKIMGAIMGDLMTYANILGINKDFGLQNVIKGICNVTDDVGVTTLKETGLLKSIVDGSKIEINIKHRDPISWKPTSQFVMCCNDIPRIQDTTGGMMRRLAFIPFDLHLKPGEMDYFLFDKISSDTDSMRYIMSSGIFAFRAAVQRGHLTELSIQKELEEDFKEINKDQIDAFYEYYMDELGSNNLGFEKNDWFLSKLCDGVTTEEVYNTYCEWCKDNLEGRIETRKTFITKFKRKLPSSMTTKLTKIGGKVFSTFIRR